jgi:hypothetical protein
MGLFLVLRDVKWEGDEGWESRMYMLSQLNALKRIINSCIRHWKKEWESLGFLQAM